jgi:hypothetical protein
MADWAGAYGAAGGHDALREVLADKIAAAKVAEDNRRAQVEEAANAQRLAMAADQFRQAQAERQGEFVSARDERYQGRLTDTERYNREAQTAATERDITRADKINTRTDTLAEHEAARQQHLADQEFLDAQRRKGEAFQAHLAAASRGPKEAGTVHFDKDADGNPRAYRIGADNVAIPIPLPGGGAGAAGGPSKADTFKTNLDTFTQGLYNHEGLPEAGAGFNLGRSYSTKFGNLKSAANQLRSMYLSDPEVAKAIAAMKPASNVDIENALRQAVNIDVENMDAPTIRNEINRLRTKQGLKPLGDGGGAAPAAGGSAPGGTKPRYTIVGVE